MNILHLSPEYFSSDSVIGGGTRYPLEIAKEMSKKGAQVRYIAFAKKEHREMIGNLEVNVYKTNQLFRLDQSNPFCFSVLKDLLWADVIHCYQLHYFLTSIAVLIGKLFGKKVFVTDLGGVERNLIKKFNLLNSFNGFLCVSQFSASDFSQYNNKVEVIYGGVDANKFTPSDSDQRTGVLFVSRIMPHKGLNYLIEALPSDVSLAIVGHIYDQEYYQYCQKLAQGKGIEFFLDLSDAGLIELYQSCAVLVLPSVLIDYRGQKHPQSELLGIPPLEAAACEMPTIATRIASLAEVVVDQKTGFLVEPNNPAALWEKIKFLLENPEQAKEMGKAGREMILKKFTWEKAAEKCLEVYVKDP